MEEEKVMIQMKKIISLKRIQDTNNTDLEEDIIHQLSKSEEKELKKFRKVDYSWM